jgi:hypothetical protein
MNEIKNLQFIKVKYLPATNTRGARVSLTDTRLKESKIIDFDYTLNTIEEMAEKYLTAKGFPIIGKTEDGIVCEAVDGCFVSIK